jgi:hypothetical protein
MRCVRRHASAIERRAPSMRRLCRVHRNARLAARCCRCRSSGGVTRRSQRGQRASARVNEMSSVPARRSPRFPLIRVRRGDQRVTHSATTSEFGLPVRFLCGRSGGGGIRTPVDRKAHNGFETVRSELVPGSLPLPPRSERFDGSGAHARTGRDPGVRRRAIGSRVAPASTRGAASAWAPRSAPTYAPRDSCASPKGLPSESLQIAHASPGWTTLPPSASTRSSASATSLTAK